GNVPPARASNCLPQVCVFLERFLDCCDAKILEEPMMSLSHRVVTLAAAGLLFVGGYAAGTWRTRTVEAQNRFGQPKTVIHVVVYKWKSFASQDDKDQTLK